MIPVNVMQWLVFKTEECYTCQLCQNYRRIAFSSRRGNETVPLGRLALALQGNC